MAYRVMSDAAEERTQYYFAILLLQVKFYMRSIVAGRLSIYVVFFSRQIACHALD